MKRRLLSIGVGMLLLATVLSVAGTVNETINEEKKSTTDIADFVMPSGKEPTPMYGNFDKAKLNSAYGLSSLPPDYEFIQEPTTIMTSHYDYMPGSYASHPIRIQTDNGDGHYVTFFAKPTSQANRRQYWAYYESDGSLQDYETITTHDKVQGYGAICIHPATGDAIASWHEDYHGTVDLETLLTYDDYDASETPGVWQDPLVVDSSGGMIYIWPYVYVGPSPLGAGYVRIYQVANNNAQVDGLPCEDVRIMWMDVENEDGADLSGLLTLENWDSVTVFTPWRDKKCRPFQSFAVDYSTPGKVGFIGCASWLDGDLGDMPVDEGAFVWESLDYGETWDVANLHSDGPGNPIYQVENPGLFEAPPELNVTISGWHNTALYDSEGNLHWTYMQAYGYSDDLGSYYFPYCMPQAEMVWDGENFAFHEVSQMSGIDPLSGHTVPWNEEEVFPVITWSTYPSAGAGVFHENNQKQAINVENDWMVQMWVDGTKHQLGLDGDPQYVDYVNHPIVYIATSIDNGNTWSDAIELTDVFSEKFDFSEQITVYPYLCDQIVDLGDNLGQIYMYYLDDSEFGSKVHGTGTDDSGDITYCSVKIKFGEPGADPELDIKDVKGGLGKVSATIENIGTVNATKIKWSITVQGGILGLINVTTEGSIETFDVGVTEAVKTDGFIFGLGKINMTIKADYADKWVGTGFVFGPFVLGIKEA